MPDQTQVRPVAHTIREAAREAKISRTLLYEFIRSGDLKARKIGRRTIITDDDLRAWLASLPVAWGA
jgi:excisionase family DNA binding protein